MAAARIFEQSRELDVESWQAAAAGRPAPAMRPCRELLERAAGIGMTVTVTPGRTIVVEGDALAHCFRVIDGAVRLYKSIADGRRQVIDFLTAGECFGFVGSDRYAYSVEAITATTLVRYPRLQFEAAIRGDDGLARRMFELACAELERAQRQMLLLGRKSAQEKIASFLLALVEPDQMAGAAVAIRLPMSRQDVADYLGLTIETVSRTLSRLRRDGLIALPCPQLVVLLRPGELRTLAEGAS
jgi:CRP/FNR family transcriptional regulator, anaerobic regulatory protein